MSLVNGEGVESDPAAEFLAREQDELAGLGDDLPDVRGVKLDGGFDDFELLAATTGSEAAPDSAAMMGDDPFGIGAVDPVAAEPAPAAFVASPSAGFAGKSKEEVKSLKEPETRTPASASPVPMSNSMREEPEKIRKWRDDQKIRLEHKDEEEEVQKAKLREQAKRELQEWYKAHEEQISKTKAHNRAAEKEYQEMTAELVPGQEWERIAKLCEFNPKPTRSNKDTSRMRSIILQLKQAPPKLANSVPS